MSIIRELKENIKDIVKNAGYDVDDIIFTPGARPDLGDYQINDAMRLAKIYKEKSIEIAEKISEELKKDSRFESINIAGPGFVNITLSPYFLYASLNKILEDERTNVDKVEKKLIFMDYGGANIAKTLHVGHLRSANIGEAVKRLAKYLGYDVISDVHFGDIGRQSGMVISEIKRRYPLLPYFDENYTGDYDSIDFTITPEELGEIYPTASIAAKNDEERMAEVVEITKELEEGNKAYTALWEKIKEVSIEDIKEVYKDLNTTFDLYEGETDCYPYISEVVEYLRNNNYLKRSEDAEVIEVAEESDKEPMPPLVVIKQNGGTLYGTRELATMYSRVKRFSPDEIWYFTDMRQSLYFKQVFRAARKTKLVPDNLVLNHYGFGTMNGSDGKPFKTRDGGVYRLEYLIDDINEAVYQKMAENKSLDEDEAKKVSKIVGLAALKYGDLSNQASKDYIFDLEKFASFEGNTGPYILYTIVRIKSILEKYKAEGGSIDGLKIEKTDNETQKDLMMEISKVNEVIENASDELAPHKICQYIYELSNVFNSFYHSTMILTEEDEDKKKGYIALLNLTKKVLETGIDLLGFSAPDKM